MERQEEEGGKVRKGRKKGEERGQQENVGKEYIQIQTDIHEAFHTLRRQ